MEHYYQEVDGWFQPNDAEFYARLVQRTPDKGKIVEVGSWMGRSLSCLLVEAKNSGKDLEITGVDTFEGSKNEPSMMAAAAAQDMEAACRNNASLAEYPFKLIRAESLEAAKQFADKSLDAVFIDGAHDLESVIQDILAWGPKVKAGGLLAGHDVVEDGVVQALISLRIWPRTNFTCWWVEVRE